jgi:arylamine N-acetyltransferase
MHSVHSGVQQQRMHAQTWYQLQDCTAQLLCVYEQQRFYTTHAQHSAVPRSCTTVVYAGATASRAFNSFAIAYPTVAASHM